MLTDWRCLIYMNDFVTILWLGLEQTDYVTILRLALEQTVCVDCWKKNAL